ncbi:MAG: metallophosphoesterase family protein [Candidatus Heimdallarchaeaceae archaeon]|jgi:3',5'-cyclic AMP phosphodiesterase CpdA
MRNKALVIGIIIVMMFTLFQVAEISVSQNQVSANSVAPWHFIAIGDTRNWDENSTNPVRSAIINHIVDTNPNLEFVLHSGDMVNNGGEQDDWDRYYEDITNATLNNITFYYAVGNHEIYTYKFPNGSYGPPELDFSTYMANVEMPGNERFYSFDFNNQIHFIIINTDEFWNGVTDSFDITPEQETWIHNDLGNNTLDFTIAMYHKPLYSVRSTGRVIDAQGVRAVLEPIFIQYEVDLTFSGHDHYYYRTRRKQITHLATGGGGAPLYTPSDFSEEVAGDVYFAEYHYCNITVANDLVKIEVLEFDEISETTTLVDSFELPLYPSLSGFEKSAAVIISLSFLLVIAQISFRRRRNR